MLLPFYPVFPSLINFLLLALSLSLSLYLTLCSFVSFSYFRVSSLSLTTFFFLFHDSRQFFMLLSFFLALALSGSRLVFFFVYNPMNFHILSSFSSSWSCHHFPLIRWAFSSPQGLWPKPSINHYLVPVIIIASFDSSMRKHNEYTFHGSCFWHNGWPIELGC